MEIKTTKLFHIIESQQKGHENEPLFMIGEQLKEIAEREPFSAEILEKDLAMEGLGLDGAAAALKKYADENRGELKCFCISPKVAENILREFYGLPAPGAGHTAPVKEAPAPSSFIDLDAFL